jgi:hypothetical protein
MSLWLMWLSGKMERRLNCSSAIETQRQERPLWYMQISGNYKKHEGKKYPCDSCDYQALERRTPYEAHHRNEKFICKECDLQASYTILNKASAIATCGYEISLWLMWLLGKTERRPNYL